MIDDSGDLICQMYFMKVITKESLDMVETAIPRQGLEGRSFSNIYVGSYKNKDIDETVLYLSSCKNLT